ncbi:MAG: thiamine-binding protein [Bacteroidales bacterium]|nr:thiamine-binding protein [Bacteroidales bacterium]
MQISLELSLYPFADDYSEDVNIFLEKLYSHPNLKIETNSMSTIISGEYQQVMELINTEMKIFFEKNKAVFIIKISNGCII